MGPGLGLYSLLPRHIRPGLLRVGVWDALPETGQRISCVPDP